MDVLQDGAGRRVAILGDMGELGENEIQLHEEVGEHAGKCDIDVLICAGKLCKNMADRAQQTNPDLKVIYEPDRETAGTSGRLCSEWGYCSCESIPFHEI